MEASNAVRKVNFSPQLPRQNSPQCLGSAEVIIEREVREILKSFWEILFSFILMEKSYAQNV
jgi:hypothetical protein